MSVERRGSSLDGRASPSARKTASSPVPPLPGPIASLVLKPRSFHRRCLSLYSLYNRPSNEEKTGVRVAKIMQAEAKAGDAKMDLDDDGAWNKELRPSFPGLTISPTPAGPAHKNEPPQDAMDFDRPAEDKCKALSHLDSARVVGAWLGGTSQGDAALHSSAAASHHPPEMESAEMPSRSIRRTGPGPGSVEASPAHMAHVEVCSPALCRPRRPVLPTCRSLHPPHKIVYVSPSRDPRVRR